MMRNSCVCAVLDPLGPQAFLARVVAEELALHDSKGGEELDRVASQHGQRVEELHGVDKLAVLREIVNDLNLGVLAKRRVT